MLKRRLLSILLAICLIAPLAVVFTVLRAEKKQVKKEIKQKLIAGLNPEELEIIKIAESQKQLLKWHHSKEFELKGEMYDIVSTEIKGDTTYYLCWWDHEETRLNKQLDLLLVDTLDKNSHQNENKFRVFKFFDSLFFLEDEKVLTYFDPIFEADIHFLTWQNRYDLILISLISPPPKSNSNFIS